jgi:endonuclease/exonuclease/phosphatase family metal-dependent hydrolase
VPHVLDTPTKPVARELVRLRTALDGVIPAKRLDRNVLVATWNLRAFAGLTERWTPRPDDSPRRNLRDLRCIAEVISRFDVVALQEVRGDIKALRHLLKALGPEWGVILTDVTKGHAGNDERMAFVFDTRRVKPSGLACELVVPVETDPRKIKPGAFNRQFARTPYAVSFLASGTTFVLVTLHVVYAKRNVNQRLGELGAIAEWLGDWARRVTQWEQNLIALGDFNIDRRGDPLFDAFTSTGLEPPAALDDVPRTIFEGGKDNFYDQIAWFTSGGKAMLSFDALSAGSFDFVPVLAGGTTRAELSWHISDHYPLWVEFGLPR